MELIAACIITVIVLQTGRDFHNACKDCAPYEYAEPKVCMEYSERMHDKDEDEDSQDKSLANLTVEELNAELDAPFDLGADLDENSKNES